MEKVMINGFEYFVCSADKMLYLDKDKKSGTPLKFLTPNENKQINDWIFYGGKPMYSFSF